MKGGIEAVERLLDFADKIEHDYSLLAEQGRGCDHPSQVVDLDIHRLKDARIA